VSDFGVNSEKVTGPYSGQGGQPVLLRRNQENERPAYQQALGGPQSILVLGDNNHLDHRFTRASLARMIPDMQQAGFTHLHLELSRGAQDILDRFQRREMTPVQFREALTVYMKNDFMDMYRTTGVPPYLQTRDVGTIASALTEVAVAARDAGVTLRAYDDNGRDFTPENYPHLSRTVRELARDNPAWAYMMARKDIPESLREAAREASEKIGEAFLRDRIGRDPEAAQRILADMAQAPGRGETVGRIAVFPGSVHALAPNGITTQLGTASGQDVRLVVMSQHEGHPQRADIPGVLRSLVGGTLTPHGTLDVNLNTYTPASEPPTTGPRPVPPI
jgi:hypothetical protein